MQIFLIVLAVLLLLFGIVLFSAVKLKLYLSKDGYLIIKYLFFSFKYDIYGDDKLKQITKKDTKKSKKSETKSSDKKEGYFKRIYTKEGIVEGTFKLLSIIKYIFSKIIELLGKCSIDNLVLNIKVATDDPAETAICYGGVCAVVYPTLGILNGMANVKKQKVNITTDYNSKNIEVSFMIFIKLPVFKATKVAFSLIKDSIQGGF